MNPLNCVVVNFLYCFPDEAANFISNTQKLCSVDYSVLPCLGVWTLEKLGKKPKFSKSFTEARPSVGHMALVALERAGYINFLVTQNIDGLHLRSGFPRNRLAILHGDVFMETCSTCGATYVRDTKTVPTFGLKMTGATCNKLKTRVRRCG